MFGVCVCASAPSSLGGTTGMWSAGRPIMPGVAKGCAPLKDKIVYSAMTVLARQCIEIMSRNSIRQ